MSETVTTPKVKFMPGIYTLKKVSLSSLSARMKNENFATMIAGSSLTTVTIIVVEDDPLGSEKTKASEVIYGVVLDGKPQTLRTVFASGAEESDLAIRAQMFGFDLLEDFAETIKDLLSSLAVGGGWVEIHHEPWNRALGVETWQMFYFGIVGIKEALAFVKAADSSVLLSGVIFGRKEPSGDEETRLRIGIEKICRKSGIKIFMTSREWLEEFFTPPPPLGLPAESTEEVTS